MLLSEIQHVRSNDGPVTVFARHHGKYTRPVMAYEFDMRLEDNPAVPKAIMRIDATWVARHPTEDLYIVYDGIAKTCRTRVTAAEMPDWREQWQYARAIWQPRPSRFSGTSIPIPETIFPMPVHGDAAWWEWIQAFDQNRQMVKAPKKPRPGEQGPEDIDERGGETADISTRLDRIYA